MEYQYIKEQANLNQLEAQIRGSAITIALDYISYAGQSLSIFFKAVLSEPEVAILGGLVAAHIPAEVPPDVQTVVVQELPEPQPFAQPTYRTKRNANASWVECPAGQATPIDFHLTEERFVTGGKLIYKDAKEGDYITADVMDTANLIPELYRVALCEDHPIVARYVEKIWVVPSNGYGSFEIDTYPLNAKISAGLVLRVTYHAVDSGEARRAAINYTLTKKLE